MNSQQLFDCRPVLHDAESPEFWLLAAGQGDQRAVDILSKPPAVLRVFGQRLAFLAESGGAVCRLSSIEGFIDFAGKYPESGLAVGAA